VKDQTVTEHETLKLTTWD